MNKKFIKIGLLILIPVIALSGFAAVANQGAAMAKKMSREALVKASVEEVTRGDIAIKVVETGSLEALQTVEVKSQVGGRVAKLLVDEGDYVQQGDLIAVIDPKETENQVKQNRAQLDGAVSSVRRIDVEIQQRRVTAQTNLNRAKIRVKQIETELRAQPGITGATIRTAETSLANAKKSRDLLINVTLPNARTQSEIAKTDADNNMRQAQVELDRQQGLYEKGYVSKREVEQAQLSLDLSKTKVRQAQESLNRLGNEQRLEREQADQRVAQAQAEVDRAKANSILDSTKKQEYESAVQSVRDAEVALKDVLVLQQQRAGSQASVDQIQSSLSESMRLLGETEVRAPISGVVTRRFVQAGELVNAVGSFSAGSPIVKIEDRTKMLVRLEINEIDVARLDLEMRSDITVDALPGSEFTGRVTKISPAQIENAAAVGGDPVVKYEVEVTLDRVDKGLKSGMSAKCEMVPESASDVLRLPVAYLGEDSSGFFVMMYDDKEVPKPLNPGEKDSFVGQRKEITIGIRDLTYVEVTSGVKEGDQVVRPKFTGPARKGMMSFGPGDDEDEEDADAKKDKSSEERKSDENKKKDPEQSGGGE